ncbi:MAG TPA: response regulator transcription factor [Longimicrobiales bacterium]|nr:response regulator transcription factor [Longimicrobiales bacterium]
MIGVLLAVRDPLPRLGARTALADQDDLRVVAEVESAGDVLEAAERHGASVVLLDAGIRAKDPTLPARLAALDPSCRTLILVEHSEEDCLLRHLDAERDPLPLSDSAVRLLEECCLVALRGSARGCLPRDATPERLRAAVRAVAAGEISAAAWIQRHLASPPTHTEGGAGRRITARELEVIQQVAAGHSNKQIGQRLGIREQTVKNHLARITSKLGVSSRVELAVLAARDLQLGKVDKGGMEIG